MNNTDTYGAHAEAAAQALNTLLVEAHLPHHPEAIDLVLQCRETVTNALCQRLYAANATRGQNMPDEDHVPAISVPVTVSTVHEHPVELIHHVAFTTPALAWEERRQPTDYLTQTSADSAARLWQLAAIEMSAGTRALTGDAPATCVMTPALGGGCFATWPPVWKRSWSWTADSRRSDCSVTTSTTTGRYPATSNESCCPKLPVPRPGAPPQTIPMPRGPAGARPHDTSHWCTS